MTAVFYPPSPCSSYVTPFLFERSRVQIIQFEICDPSSGSSNRGGASVQRQAAQSPADVAQLELPDLGAEDVLELQLQQLTLAQFTVATMTHAIPLLKTGRSHWLCIFRKDKGFVNYINRLPLFLSAFHPSMILSPPQKMVSHSDSLFFSEGLHTLHRVLELLCDAVHLLGDSVRELVWDDRSLVGTELASRNATRNSLFM